MGYLRDTALNHSQTLAQISAVVEYLCSDIDRLSCGDLEGAIPRLDAMQEVIKNLVRNARISADEIETTLGTYKMCGMLKEEEEGEEEEEKET